MEADLTSKGNEAGRGENISQMEPLRLGEDSRRRPEITDLAFELAQRSAGFQRSLPVSIVATLATLVRSVDCYYSNLIEGHDTHPVDIERALKNDFSTDRKRRDLQLEATAHIAVQRWIDEGGVKGRATSLEGIREIHRRFCERLPEDLL
jgi:Fic family protein